MATHRGSGSREVPDRIEALVAQSQMEVNANKNPMKALALRREAALLALQSGNKERSDKIMFGAALPLIAAGKKKAYGDWFSAVDLFREALQILIQIEHPNRVEKASDILNSTFTTIDRNIKVANSAGDETAVQNYLCEATIILSLAGKVYESESRDFRGHDYMLHRLLNEYSYTRGAIDYIISERQEKRERIRRENELSNVLSEMQRVSRNWTNYFVRKYEQDLESGLKHAGKLEKKKDNAAAFYMYCAMAEIYNQDRDEQGMDNALAKAAENANAQMRKMENINKLPEALFWCRRAEESFHHSHNQADALHLRVREGILRDDIEKLQRS